MPSFCIGFVSRGTGLATSCVKNKQFLDAGSEWKILYPRELYTPCVTLLDESKSHREKEKNADMISTLQATVHVLTSKQKERTETSPPLPYLFLQ